MRTMKDSTRLTIFCVLFCVLALIFFALYKFEVISNLDFYSASVYIIYFAGLALAYNGQRLKANGKNTSAKICYIFSTIIILLALVMLIYGFATGTILFWLW